MKKDEGFLTIIALLVTTLVVILTLYLLSTSEFNRLIINATEKSIQAYYSAESKLYLLLNKDEYYYGQLMPRVERFIKYGRISPNYDPRITLSKNDLIDGDNGNVIRLNFIAKNDRQCLELSIDSNKDKITKSILVELFLVNELFEMKLPIISHNTLDDNKIEEFTSYMNYLQEKIDFSKLDDEITGIYVSDYDEINVIPQGNSLLIQYFRNEQANPVTEEIIVDHQIFLCLKNNEADEINLNLGNGLDNISIQGIIYVEGDLNIYGNVRFSGIIIVNGKIVIHPDADVNVNGIILVNKGIENNGNNQFIVNYDFLPIKRYGVYLPKFVDIKVNKIKIN